MKYRLGSVTIEVIDTYVRVSVANIGGPDAPVRVAVTKRQRPKASEVVSLLNKIPGHDYNATAIAAGPLRVLGITARTGKRFEVLSATARVSSAMKNYQVWHGAIRLSRRLVMFHRRR